ncbi:hypothetical protein [Vagococcus fluvialis]|uniref:hypothetical protein n=1 Tax=Vagococcus fluvialis TaxID=2738 RepID=UPI003D13C74A
MSSNEILLFKKSLGYKQLENEQKVLTEDILNKLSEYMFNIYNKHIYDWEPVELQSIFLTVFQEEILADKYFFESIYEICFKFFEFLYFSQSLYFVRDWLIMLNSIKDQIVINYEIFLNKNPAEQDFLDLGKELGLNMSKLDDINKLYELCTNINISNLSRPVNFLVTLK